MFYCKLFLFLLKQNKCPTLIYYRIIFSSKHKENDRFMQKKNTVAKQNLTKLLDQICINGNHFYEYRLSHKYIKHYYFLR